MKVKIWPSAKFGQAATVLTFIFFLLMFLKFGSLGIRIILPFPSPFIAALGIVGFVFGLISIIKNKDRAILTWLSIPTGLLIILWVGAEMIFPH